MSVKAVLRKDRQRSDGKQPINIRVTRQGNASYVSMKIYIDPKNGMRIQARQRQHIPATMNSTKKLRKRS